MSIFDLAYMDNHGHRVELSQFIGLPLLIVNTASKCGFTPQYAGLERLHEHYSARGLVVIGFPCDQFGHQEPGDDAEIEEFCRVNHGVTFRLATKVDVNGPEAHPVFEFLKAQSGGILTDAIKWNFTKFLVAPDGVSVSRFAPTTRPEQLVGDIEGLLRAA